MSYLDQTGRRNPASIAAVVGIHLAVGYALVSGFAITVIKDIPRIPLVVSVTDPPPPPPKPTEVQHIKQTSTNVVQLPKPTDALPTQPQVIKTPDFGEVTGTIGGGGGVVAPPPDIPQPSKASDAVAAKDRMRWITTDDYPTNLLRQEVQGLVVISVTIGTDGRVRSCLVTQSSGNRQLDDTTCRLYTQHARFTPARDADGNPTIAQRTDRYRWQIPNE